MRMKQTILVLGITFICLFNPACSTKVVKGTVGGIEVTVQSQRRTKEYKPPGSGTEYGQMKQLQSGAEKEFLVIELKAPKKIEFGDKGIKAKVKDDKGQTYNSVYSEVFGFNDDRTEAKILFEVPEHTVLSTLMLDDTSFDLSKVRD
jgi:hypothetical protein